MPEAKGPRPSLQRATLIPGSRQGLQEGSDANCLERRIRTHPKTGVLKIISSPEVSARPYLRFHAISSLCPIVYGLARPVRASTRANATWRVVGPPRSAVPSAKRPLAPLGLRPREWAGVSQKPLHKPSNIDLSVAFFRAKTSFSPRSQPLRKIRVASLGTVSTLRLSSRRGRATLASGGGRMMLGMAARSSSQCR
jgi:hypothetical protein